ncbi:septal ring lytic transglycosylase RlpA family protein [Rhodanobacter glycinis]|uniref:Endolytic peptidoglycan transglycosylase RlpA n=1 Tax=Rhodanobacter glycinis TaxID=582702 RepID=A0A502BU49_9GAMM|nr:septal ring lytic transglycosylase RlpA family protein [Rhodanobacter glycinis]TPG04023.1 septal ring lytic transglycosylase RlpA family protein [Rhodanobacter glycinis]TPG48443.1 septal ring lytic transglycosylase RlpA family protein [Rhodanobacter glycinis]
MRAAGRLVLLLAMSLLAGCGGKRTRPSHAADSARHEQGRADSSRGADSFRDDLSKSQSSRYRDGSDSVPGDVPDIGKLVEPVPRIEPRSLYGNKSPYTVLGHSYRVLPSARGYDERGIASFYGNKFHGYKTSSLETYDMYAFSAASTTLPLPSYARVTNLENGKSVIVRINDRGPFHQNRLIDLSYAAAVKIGIWPKGTGLVEVRGIDPGSSSQELPPPTVVTTGHLGIYLQVGAFSDADNAERLAQRLRQANVGAVQVMDAEVNGRHVRRVRVGPLADVDRADQVSARIEGMGLPRPQVAVD